LARIDSMPAAPEYFEHGADIGVIGRGATVEAAFVDAAQAMFAIMVDFDGVRADECVAVEFDEDDRELALVRWLNALLAAAREHRLVLARFTLERRGDHWRGMGCGEPWRETLVRGTEVKGATLTALSVRQVDGGWEARCVVDV
jgi:SHS2 domain-containing protein